MPDRLRGRKVCADCERAAAQARAQAVTHLQEALPALISTGSVDSPEAERVRTLAAAIGDAAVVRSARRAHYLRLLDEALADEIITQKEEIRLGRIGEVIFDGDEDAQMEALAPYRTQLFIAMVNDGRLPIGEDIDPPIVLKKGELLHLIEPATLLKEVVHREFRSGSRGVSFRVMKGVSYRVGASRGKMVEVGRSLADADEGQLSVTSTRIVFTGLRKTSEMQYTKLLDLNVFNDAIQIHVSNRQTPSTFRVSSGPMVAAVINAAVQRFMA